MLTLVTLIGVGCSGTVDEPVAAHDDGIVGGQLDSGDPAVMLLLSQDSAGNQAFCSATLITDRRLLTAAHCIPLNADFAVYRGSDAVHDTDPTHWLDVAHVYPNTGFNLAHPENGYDFAVVELATPISDIAPIPLHRSTLTVGSAGLPVRLVGFGRTGPQAGGGVKNQLNEIIWEVDRLVFYAGHWGKSVCFGDSGGPALVQGDHGEEVAGVTSYSEAPCNIYGAFGRVELFTGFIDSPQPPPPPLPTPCVESEKEPNDVWGHAQKLCPATALSANVEGPDGIDWFSWQPPANEQFTATVDLPAAYLVHLYVAYDTEEGWTEIAGKRSDTGLKFNTLTGLHGGATFYLEVKGGAATPYSLTITYANL